MREQKKIQIPPIVAGKRLSEWLSNQGYEIPAACGGRGTCGKCGVRVVSGHFYQKNHPEEMLQPDAAGWILSCQAICSEEEAEIILEESGGSGLTEFMGMRQESSQTSMEEAWGIALDIGTTTLAAALVEGGTGRILSTVSRLNPQRSFGADVISRISACQKGYLPQLSQLIRSAAAEMTEELLKAFPQTTPGRMAVSGNTTMLHLFCQASPEGMGAYPFTPLFTEEKVLPGSEVSHRFREIVVLPSASAFIGSDLTGGVYACRMTELEEPSILMDFGTNGEMVLCTGTARGGRLYCASAAAGPALEGANISCGVGGIAGAVSRVGCGPVKTYQTIGDREPVGLCGCGLVDLVAALLQEGLLDETGYLEEEEYTLIGIQEGSDGRKLSLCRETGITLTQQDIREFQLAKSAMRAGFEALADSAGIPVEEIRHIFIAGGLGYYMDIENAMRVGLLSRSLRGEIKTVGNTSLAGAIAVLTLAEARKEICNIAAGCETIELNKSAVFNEGFMEHMLFPEVT